MLPRDPPPALERPKFILGRVMVTSTALHQLTLDDITAGLRRHVRGDWGEVDDDDWRANNDALKNGERLLSTYDSSRGIRFWIVSEADRSLTTILLPEDY